MFPIVGGDKSHELEMKYKYIIMRRGMLADVELMAFKNKFRCASFQVGILK